MHILNRTILRAYDIRGIVEQTLTYEDAYHIGRAFATMVSNKIEKNNPIICVGLDGRLTSPKLRDNLIKGLKESGAKVYDVGVGPTPMTYFSVKYLGADAGIMITGSHNPPSHNGFKMMLTNRPFYGEDILELGEIVRQGKYNNSQGLLENNAIVDKYVDMLASKINSPVGKKKLKVVWDPGNGAAGEVVEKLVKFLPGEHIVINGKIDGSFPSHHPDPSEEENLHQLIGEVKNRAFDLGIAFDGDGDRIGIVDSQGRILAGDQILTILAMDIVKNIPNAKVIFDIKSSKFLLDYVNKIGGKAILWKTGHSLIKAKMIEEKAHLAGEMSGHIFFGDNNNFDDALYASVKFLNILYNNNNSLDEIFDSLPKSIVTPEMRIEVKEEEKFSIIDKIKLKLKKAGRDFTDIDGVRVETYIGWWLIRASNTQAVLVMRCEASNSIDLDILIKDCKSYL